MFELYYYISAQLIASVTLCVDTVFYFYVFYENFWSVYFSLLALKIKMAAVRCQGT